MNYYTQYYGYDIAYAEAEQFNEYLEIADSESVNEEWFEEFDF